VRAGSRICRGEAQPPACHAPRAWAARLRGGQGRSEGGSVTKVGAVGLLLEA
jgi:hypothetical protein